MLIDQSFWKFFTLCNLNSLTFKSVKIQIVFSVKKEQKQQFVLTYEVRCVLEKSSFYATYPVFIKSMMCAINGPIWKKIL